MKKLSEEDMEELSTSSETVDPEVLKKMMQQQANSEIEIARPAVHIGNYVRIEEGEDAIFVAMAWGIFLLNLILLLI